MKRIVKYRLIAISILIIGLFITLGIFISTFDIFGEPEKDILEINCDNRGLRNATIFEYGGNAVTVPAIIVSIDLGCDNLTDNSKKKIVFSAEKKGGTTVETKWKSFDTLKVIYSDRLQPVTKIDQVNYLDSTLDVVVEFLVKQKSQHPPK